MLFEPTRLGALALANRVVMAPLTRQRADAQGVPLPFVAEYYAQRATAGLIVAEGTQPSFMGQGYCRTPGIHTPDQVAAWRRVTDAVHAAGGRIVVQLMHAGRIAHHLNRQLDAPPVAPSAIRAAGAIWTDQHGPLPHDEPRALDTAEIPALVEEFAAAARHARDAGFDGVEVHAANGYLLNQFLATGSNRRGDAYGGSAANRARLVVEVVEAVAAAIGAGRTGIRVSPGHMFNDLRDDNPLETHRTLLDALPTRDMAYVHVMRPDSFDASLNNAGDPAALLAALRPHVKGPLVEAGNFTAATAEARLREGAAEAIAFGRPFIGNPDLVRRLREGAPLAEARPELFYTPGPEGYVDYPPLAA